MNLRLTLVTLSLAMVAGLNAQQPSASVVGRVTDATGAVIPGVAIKITNLDTNIAQTGTSNHIGDFTIPYLNPGRYKMEAALTGFRTYKHTEFTLMVDQVLRVDLPLEVGSAAESITVTDTPPVLNTESGARGEVTTNKEIAEMPLDGRNFSDLAYLTGGVIPKGDGGDGAYAVNGARADNFGFVIDGVENTPKLNTGRNRTFFMVSWDSLRNINGKTQRGITPTPEMLKGDFSKATDALGKPIALTDPIAKAPFAGNQIPVNRFDPVAVKLAAF